MDKYILLILIFFLPFLVHKFGISSFETPKVIVAEILISTLAVLNILKVKNFSWRQFTSLPYLFILVLLALSLFHVLTSSFQVFFGNIFRLQGVFLFWILIIFALSSGQVSLKANYKWVYPIAIVLIFVSAFYYRDNLAGRAVGVLGEPNALAATALIFFTFIYFYQKKWVIALSFFLLSIIFYLSHSRSAVLALVAEATFVISNIRFKPKKATLLSLTFVGLSLITPFLGSLSTLGSTVKPVVPGFEDRGDIWYTSAYAGLKSPLVGVGFGNIQDTIHKTAQELNLRIQYSVIDSSHNFILDYWIEGGILAVICILGLIFISIKSFIREKQLFELTLFLGVITVMLFNPVTIIILLTFWWLIGRGINIYCRGERT